MSQDVVYTLHLWPPLRHAAHYTGKAESSRFLKVRISVSAVEFAELRGGAVAWARVVPGGRVLCGGAVFELLEEGQRVVGRRWLQDVFCGERLCFVPAAGSPDLTGGGLQVVGCLVLPGQRGPVGSGCPRAIRSRLPSGSRSSISHP